MKQTMMKGVAIAFFAAAMNFGAAAPAHAACVNGSTKTTRTATHITYYTCRSNQWVFVKMCPIGGGSCAV